MKKYIKEICMIIVLLILLILIGILIYIKKESLKNESDLVGTSWILNKIENYEGNTMSEKNDYEQLLLNFMKDYVSICAFYNDTNTCSMNQYSKVDNTYNISKGDFLDINGIVTYDENGNLKLEQTINNNSKIIYYFEREE